MRKTVITGLTALTLLYGCSRDDAPKPTPQPQQNAPEVVPQPEPQPTPVQPQSYVTVSLHSQADGLETAFDLSFSQRAARDFAQYESAVYRIEGTNIQGEMYFQRGMSGLKNTFAEPMELEGRDLVIFGKPYHTNDWQELYRVRLGEE